MRNVASSPAWTRTTERSSMPLVRMFHHTHMSAGLLPVGIGLLRNYSKSSLKSRDFFAKVRRAKEGLIGKFHAVTSMRWLPPTYFESPKGGDFQPSNIKGREFLTGDVCTTYMLNGVRADLKVQVTQVLYVYNCD